MRSGPRSVNITFWNANGMNNILFNDYNTDMHVICFSETMVLNDSPQLIPPQLRNYAALWSNAIKDKVRGRGSGGLLCLI